MTQSETSAERAKKQLNPPFLGRAAQRPGFATKVLVYHTSLQVSRGAKERFTV